MFRKIKKTVLMMVMVGVLFSGCDAKQQADQKSEFIKYMQEQQKNKLESIKLPSDVRVKISKFDIDIKEKIAVVNFDLTAKDWEFMTYEEMKKDGIFLSTIVQQYANYKKCYDEKYKLYIVFKGVLSQKMYYTYYYNTNELIVSEKHERYLSLYDKYRTDDLQAIADYDPAIVDKMVLWGFGEIENRKFKVNNDAFYSIYVIWTENRFSFNDVYIGNRLKKV